MSNRLWRTARGCVRGHLPGRPGLGAADPELLAGVSSRPRATTRASAGRRAGGQPRLPDVRHRRLQRRRNRAASGWCRSAASSRAASASSTRGARCPASTPISRIPTARRSIRTRACAACRSTSRCACCRSGRTSGVQPYFGGGADGAQLALQRVRRVRGLRCGPPHLHRASSPPTARRQAPSCSAASGSPAAAAAPASRCGTTRPTRRCPPTSPARGLDLGGWTYQFNARPAVLNDQRLTTND